jgi:hypothetical protein
MSRKSSLEFDPDFVRGRMAELERQRRLALRLLVVGCVGLGLMFCALLLASGALLP